MGIVQNDIWEEYRRSRDPVLRDRLCESYLDLVRMVASRMISGLPAHVDMDDLVANGFLGLLDAIERYDPRRGFKFETYATSRIRGAILDGLRAVDWLPGTVRKRVREVEREMQKLENKLGRPPANEELAESLGLSRDELDSRLLECLHTTTVSLYEPWLVNDGEGVEWGQVLADANAEDPFENAWLRQRKEILADAIGKLSEKEQVIISLHYYEGLTGAEIAQILELTPSRISQLHARALMRLRSYLQAV